MRVRIEISITRVFELIDELKQNPQRVIDIDFLLTNFNRIFTAVFQTTLYGEEGFQTINFSVISRGATELGFRFDIDLRNVRETFNFIELSARIFTRVECALSMGPAMIALIAARGATAAARGGISAARGVTSVARVAAPLAAELAIGSGIILAVIAANAMLFDQIRQSVEEGQRRGLWLQFARGYVMFLFFPANRARWFDAEVRDPGARQINNSRQLARILGIDRARRDGQREGLQEARDRMISEYLPTFAGREEAEVQRELPTMIFRFGEHEFSTGRDPLIYERF